MTPGAIAARWSALREAGAALRQRPVLEALTALARVLDAWTDAGSRWRRALEAELPAATGFSPETVREGLARGLAGWSGGALLEVAERELGDVERLERGGHHMVSGFEATAVVLAGSIPMPSLPALLAPLALRSPVLAKAAARDPVTPELVARSVAETDAGLGACVTALDFPGADAARMEALLAGADCVVATGSDRSVAAVAAHVAPPQRLVTYGHRLSMAALGRGATRGAALVDAAERAALDVALWDQLGCLSPQALYVVDSDAAAADRVAEAVAQALDAAGRRWPRGAVPDDAAALAAHERRAAEMRAAAGRRVAVHAADDAGWTVVREDDAAVRAAPLHRFLRIVPVEDTAGLYDALRPVRRHLAAVGIAGFGDHANTLARLLADLGAARVCPLGSMQSPPLGWQHEGLGLLLPLARLSALEG